MSAPDGEPFTAIRLHPDDTVACALRDLAPGAVPRMAAATPPFLREAIRQGHKFALTAIAAGDAVVKYGHPIGRATRDIEPGCHVHEHNLEGYAGAGER